MPRYASLIWILALAGIQEAIAYTVVMCIFSVGVALCYGVTFTASMELFPDLKGAASTLNMSLRLVIVSLVIYAVGAFANGTFIPETTLIFTCAALSAVLFMFVIARPRVSPLLA